MQANQLSTLVYFAFLVWAAVLAIGGTAVPEGWRAPLPTVVAVVGWAAFAFDRWLWKFPLLYPWFAKQPNLHGTFRATLESTWVSPETGRHPDPIEAYFVIRQRYSAVSVRMFTKESSSTSLAASFCHDSDGGWTFIATYQNCQKVWIGVRLSRKAPLPDAPGPRPPDCGHRSPSADSRRNNRCGSARRLGRLRGVW